MHARHYENRLGHRLRFGCILVCLCALSAQSFAVRPTRLLADFRKAQAIVETSDTRCLFLDIFIAESPGQRSRGLMFVEQMDEMEGMLFTYPEPAEMTMWMKNTYIALDMLFIRADGTISSIESKTKPLSTARISSTEPVTMVLELNAGFADRWHIEPGNRLLAVD